MHDYASKGVVIDTKKNRKQHVEELNDLEDKNNKKGIKQYSSK